MRLQLSQNDRRHLPIIEGKWITVGITIDQDMILFMD